MSLPTSQNPINRDFKNQKSKTNEVLALQGKQEIQLRADISRGGEWNLKVCNRKRESGAMPWTGCEGRPIVHGNKNEGSYAYDVFSRLSSHKSLSAS